MTAFLFTWNPRKWQWSDLPQAVFEANCEGGYLYQWSCVSTRRVGTGDRAFLMRLGVPPKGIMGSGIVVSEPFEDAHWNPERAKNGEKIHYTKIIFDVLSDNPLISEGTLSLDTLADHHWFPQGSGTRIPDKVAAKLENVWSKVTGTVFTPPTSEELPGLRWEGIRKTRLVTTYERDPKARRKCLEYHGTSCHICGFSFESRYGDVGKGFIHVHHIVPVSEMHGEYRVNPITDLRPVCPNCHAMLHKRTPPYTIEEIEEVISST